MAGEMPRVWIVHYTKAYRTEDGALTNLRCDAGPEEEVRERARKFAEEHGMEVAAVV